MFIEQGKTKLGLINPVQMLSALSQNVALLRVAQEVQTATIQMIDEAKGTSRQPGYKSLGLIPQQTKGVQHD